jgi:hypothetical protein
MDDVDTASLLFSFPDDIIISLIRTTTTEVVLHIASQRPCATCPLCEQPSERVHGRYARTVADLPCSGRRVMLALNVRKFVCPTPACTRQIFTERLASTGAVVCAHDQSPTRGAARARSGHQCPGERTTGTIAGHAGFGSHEARTIYARSPARRQSRFVFLAWMTGVRHEVACIAVRTHERGILPGVLPPSALLG